MSERQKSAFRSAMIAEGVCLLGGVAGYLFTDKMIWLFIGVIAGLGFSIPAIIQLMTASRERDGA